MTSDPVAALKAAYENAAVGKWTYRAVSWEAWYDIHDGEGTKLGETITSSDAAFIVTAHSLARALIAECERLRGVERELIDLKERIEMVYQRAAEFYPPGNQHVPHIRAILAALGAYDTK